MFYNLSNVFSFEGCSTCDICSEPFQDFCHGLGEYLFTSSLTALHKLSNIGQPMRLASQWANQWGLGSRLIEVEETPLNHRSVQDAHAQFWNLVLHRSSHSIFVHRASHWVARIQRSSRILAATRRSFVDCPWHKILMSWAARMTCWWSVNYFCIFLQGSLVRNDLAFNSLFRGLHGWDVGSWLCFQDSPPLLEQACFRWE